VRIASKLLVPLVFVSAIAVGQQAPATPQVKVNYLNVCAPSEADYQEIASALGRIPARPRFATDFEVSRGRSSLSENLLAAGEGAKMNTDAPAVSRWVRVRKEFPEQSKFTNAQYSFSVTENHVVETLVFRSRETKDLLQVSLSDTVNASEPATVVRGDTPADRIRIERFGKSSLVVARCKDSDQSKYEPLFQQASSLLAAYRKSLAVRNIVPADLAKVPLAVKPAAKP
jgi:hypothetical protein